MDIYLKYKNGTKTPTRRKLLKLGLFSKVEPFAENTFRLVTSTQVYQSNKAKTNLIMKKLSGMDGASNVKIYSDVRQPKNNLVPKLLHIFADIDSTLTHNGTNALNSNVKSYIGRINDAGSNFYFCSGRSFQDIDRLRKRYETGEYGIAENGGIIIGMPGEDWMFGDVENPNKLLHYLMTQKAKGKSNFKIDTSQKNRTTEIILLKNSITESELNIAIKRSNANVEYHSSKNSFHISKKRINKGTAIETLTSFVVNANPDLYETVAIGDSGLDVAMFKHVDRAFIVGRPDRDLAKKIKPYKEKVTKLPIPPKAIEKMYEILFPYG